MLPTLVRCIAPVIVAAALAAAAAPSAIGQEFPTRPVRMIVGFSPGGANDTLGRMVANKLTERWGKQVVADILAVQDGKDLQDTLAKEGAAVVKRSGAEFGEHITSEIAKWAKVIKAGNIKLE